MIPEPKMVSTIEAEWPNSNEDNIVVFDNNMLFHFSHDQLIAFMSGMVYALNATTMVSRGAVLLTAWDAAGTRICAMTSNKHGDPEMAGL